MLYPLVTFPVIKDWIMFYKESCLFISSETEKYCQQKKNAYWCMFGNTTVKNKVGQNCCHLCPWCCISFNLVFWILDCFELFWPLNVHSVFHQFQTENSKLLSFDTLKRHQHTLEAFGGQLNQKLCTVALAFRNLSHVRSFLLFYQHICFDYYR